jgi:mannosyl-oligosaccharide alpha-1,3-glucosidase
VTIIDPHIKVDTTYSVFKDAKAFGYFVKSREDGDYEGHCWPGTSSWLDFSNPEVRSFFARQFAPFNYPVRFASHF